MLNGHNLRSNLQEWRSRLIKSSYALFPNAYKQFFSKINSTPSLISILRNAMDEVPLSDEQVRNYLKQLSHGRDLIFENEIEQTSILYNLHYKIFSPETLDDQLVVLTGVGNYDKMQTIFIEKFIDPIVTYLHDNLDNSNSILYIFEKYKRRTEWFQAQDLRSKYLQLEKNYEKLLEDDLRLYLFDQGIDYPFSTPASTSGRTDIVGLIDTKNPLIIEIKIYDSDKGYKKDRIKSGFAQIVKYAGDYNKQVGYLVVFNLDEAPIHIQTEQKDNTFPYRIEAGGKVFYIIIVNLNFDTTASKTKILKTIDINAAELLESSF